MAFKNEIITGHKTGRKIELSYTKLPVSHDEWHTAEELGLVYVYTDTQGNDLWDYKAIFCKPEDEEIVSKMQDWYFGLDF